MYHELVAAGQEQKLMTGETVKVVCVEVTGVLEITIPDHVEDGKIVGQGGTIRVRKGDFLVGREDGTVFGVAATRYGEFLSAAAVTIPKVALRK